MESRNQPVKQMEKTIQFANQVRDLKAVLDKAAADEGKNPTAAVSDYETAMAIDGRIGAGSTRPTSSSASASCRFRWRSKRSRRASTSRRSSPCRRRRGRAPATAAC